MIVRSGSVLEIIVRPGNWIVLNADSSIHVVNDDDEFAKYFGAHGIGLDAPYNSVGVLT